MLTVTAFLWDPIAQEIEVSVPEPAPVIGIFGLLPLLAIVGVVLLLVGWALGMWKTSPEDERG